MKPWLMFGEGGVAGGIPLSQSSQSWAESATRW